MTYDGIFIKAQIHEILGQVLNEHISRITERSQNEVSFHIHKNGKNLNLSFSADPNFPCLLLSENIVENSDTPPAFCMILRKYLRGGKIIDMKQVNNLEKNADIVLERIVDVVIENISDIGDIQTYHLFIEIMGKYSNIILTDKSYIILDVLKKNTEKNARLKQKAKYEIDSICSKKEIFAETNDGFLETIKNYKTLCEVNNEKYDIYDAISKSYAGISRKSIYDINNTDFDFIKNGIRNAIKNNITPNKDLYSYINDRHNNLNDSTEKKNVEVIIKNLNTKLNKKLDLIKKDITKTDDYEKHKKYGDLLSAYGFSDNPISNNAITCADYTDNNKIVNVPIDTTISIAQNIKKYYDKYNKLKRTKEKASEIYNETLMKIEHLNSIKESLEFSNDKNDIYLIKEEIINYFDEAKKSQSLKKQKSDNKVRKSIKSQKALNYNIHHYKASNGIDIYVGKNNLQNEYLTFTLASPDDTWLHIKDATGSHVIIKKSYEKLDDQTLLEAASLAAYFSEKRNETKATVDYTLRKELKKVKGKAPGFCIYHKNYSINVKPEITINEV